MARNGFSCFIGFQKFLGEDPRPPPPFPDLEMWFFFQSNTAQHKPKVKSKVFNAGIKQQE